MPLESAVANVASYIGIEFAETSVKETIRRILLHGGTIRTRFAEFELDLCNGMEAEGDDARESGIAVA